MAQFSESTSQFVLSVACIANQRAVLLPTDQSVAGTSQCNDRSADVQCPDMQCDPPMISWCQPGPVPCISVCGSTNEYYGEMVYSNYIYYILSNATHVQCLWILILLFCNKLLFRQIGNWIFGRKWAGSAVLINPVVPYSKVCNPCMRVREDWGCREDFTLSAASRAALVHKVPCGRGISLGLMNILISRQDWKKPKKLPYYADASIDGL